MKRISEKSDASRQLTATEIRYSFSSIQLRRSFIPLCLTALSIS